MSKLQEEIIKEIRSHDHHIIEALQSGSGTQYLDCIVYIAEAIEKHVKKNYVAKDSLSGNGECMVTKKELAFLNAFNDLFNDILGEE